MAILGIFSMLLSGCVKEQVPTKKDLVGEWKSQYKEIFTLNDNDTFTIENLRSEIFFWPTSGEKINGKGTWKLQKINGSWRLSLRYSAYTKNGTTEEIKTFNDIFYIQGSGFLGNNLPWIITSWDENDDYSRFEKMK